jgi:hypothetical protein
MFSYVAYGLGIHSSIPLPELVAKDVHADLTIREGKVDTPAEVIRISEWTSLVPGGAIIRHESAKFSVRNGNEITLDVGQETDLSILRRYLLGQVLGMVLHQRGFLVLHASAVSIADRAVIFLGGAGWGKSTTAAALNRRGHTLISDDITPVKMEGNAAILLPGYPQMKISSETAISLKEDITNLEPLRGTRKYAHRVADQFSLNPLPLKRIYVLRDSENLGIQKLGSKQALIELIRHSYFARFIKDLDIATHHSQCAALIQAVTAFTLKRPRDLSLLPDIAKMIEEDLDHE